MAYNVQPKTLDDYKTLAAYVKKYPDKLEIVNTIVNVYNLGALDSDLCEIFRRNVDHVLKLSEVRSINSAQPVELIRKIRRKSNGKSLAHTALEILKREGRPVSVAVLTKELKVRPSSCCNACADARKLLKKGEKISSASMDGMRYYEFRKD